MVEYKKIQQKYHDFIFLNYICVLSDDSSTSTIEENKSNCIKFQQEEKNTIQLRGKDGKRDTQERNMNMNLLTMIYMKI